jgi:hypothetical protein
MNPWKIDFVGKVTGKEYDNSIDSSPPQSDMDINMKVLSWLAVASSV